MGVCHEQQADGLCWLPDTLPKDSRSRQGVFDLRLLDSDWRLRIVVRHQTGPKRGHLSLLGVCSAGIKLRLGLVDQTAGLSLASTPRDTAA